MQLSAHWPINSLTNGWLELCQEDGLAGKILCATVEPFNCLHHWTRRLFTSLAEVSFKQLVADAWQL